MYGDNLPPGCTLNDIERAAGGDEDEPRGTQDGPALDFAAGPDHETWDDRGAAAAQHSVSLVAMNAMRNLMGLAPLPEPSA